MSGAPAARPPTPRSREEFRAFVRQHHPDVGGDADVFAEVVAEWRRGAPERPNVVFYRKRSLLEQLLEVLLERLPTPRRSPRNDDRRAR